MRCVRENKEHIVNSTIALSFANAPDERLHVADPSLDLDTHQKRLESEKDVPRPLIADVRQQRFAADDVRGRNAFEDSLDRCLLPAVTNGVAVRCRLADSSKPRTEAISDSLIQWYGRKPELLQSAELGLGDTKLVGERTLAEPGELTLVAQLVYQPAQSLRAQPAAAL